MTRALLLVAVLATPAFAETLRSGPFTLELPLGLQAGAAYVPDQNPLSADKIALGRLLYFDPRLSKDGTISCASCHIPFHGFTDPHPTSEGVGQQPDGHQPPLRQGAVLGRPRGGPGGPGEGAHGEPGRDGDALARRRRPAAARHRGIRAALQEGVRH